MTYRLLCDENVERAAVSALTERGFDAIHVTDRPGPGSSDHEVARSARAEERVLVTNDDDFLDDEYAAVPVLYYPENHLAGHVVAERIETLRSIVSDQNDLPGVLFLTESNLPR